MDNIAQKTVRPLHSALRPLRDGASALVLSSLAAYRYLLSPALTSLTGCGCRFEPTCSHYASEAIGRFGLLRGGRLASARLWRCRPGGGWGFDPVPPASKSNRDHQDLGAGLSGE